MKLSVWGLTAVVVLAVASAASGITTTLYDGTLGTRPDAQQWKYVTNPPEGATVSQSWAGNVTTLNTSADKAKQNGYFSEFPLLGRHPSMPASLDRSPGWHVAFDLRIAAESHNAIDHNGDGVSDRAGYSVIALSSDRKGVELAFWDNAIWAYDRADIGGGTMEFVHAETVARDTTSSLTSYDLRIQGDCYTLLAGATPILTGALRDYSGEGFPYTTASFLFLGDDSANASSVSELGYVGVGALAAVPEPGTLALLALGGLALIRRRSR